MRVHRALRGSCYPERAAGVFVRQSQEASYCSYERFHQCSRAAQYCNRCARLTSHPPCVAALARPCCATIGHSSRRAREGSPMTTTRRLTWCGDHLMKATATKWPRNHTSCYLPAIATSLSQCCCSVALSFSFPRTRAIACSVRNHHRPFSGVPRGWALLELLCPPSPGSDHSRASAALRTTLRTLRKGPHYQFPDHHCWSVPTYCLLHQIQSSGSPVSLPQSEMRRM